MAALLRLLAAVAMAVALALPGVSDEGGENNGGVGVWVLPRASCVPPIAAAPRAVRNGVPIAQDCLMKVSDECGPTAATFVDDMSGLPVSLHVSGSVVRVPASLLQALAAMPLPTASVLITDSQHVGYVALIAVHANGTATIRVF